MVDEFDLPADIIDRKVTKMKMISPSNREVDVGKTLSETEYIGMCRREVRHFAKIVGDTWLHSLSSKPLEARVLHAYSYYKPLSARMSLNGLHLRKVLQHTSCPVQSWVHRLLQTARC